MGPDSPNRSKSSSGVTILLSSKISKGSSLNVRKSELGRISTQREFRGCTALHYGACSGQLDATGVLVRAGDETNALGNDKITCGHQEVLEC
jgi:ankyrin repeat protein